MLELLGASMGTVMMRSGPVGGGGGNGGFGGGGGESTGGGGGGGDGEGGGEGDGGGGEGDGGEGGGEGGGETPEPQHRSRNTGPRVEAARWTWRVGVGRTSSVWGMSCG